MLKNYIFLHIINYINDCGTISIPSIYPSPVRTSVYDKTDAVLLVYIDTNTESMDVHDAEFAAPCANLK